MARLAGREEVYATAKRFVEEALKSDGSLFTPGTAIWSTENIEDLYERFVGNWVWVCPVFTDCLPLSHGTSTESRFLVL